MTCRNKVKLLLWSYFWLLIIEGCLRKWIFPSLSNAFLVIRDPIAVLAIIVGLRYLLRSRWTHWVLAFWLIGIISVFLALTFGHGDILTALFGARVFLIHLPLIFLFSEVFDNEDVIYFLKASAVIAIPMTILAGLQYTLPQEHFLNLAPGGQDSAGLAGALGKFRPPGTFSYITGLVDFYSIASIGVIAIFFLLKKPLPIWFFPSLLSIVSIIPISISRSLLYIYIVNIIFSCFSLISSKKKLIMAIPFIVLILISIIIASAQSIVDDAQEVFLARWVDANSQEGGSGGVFSAIKMRIQSGTLEELQNVFYQPLLGRGVGLGSNVGAMRFKGTRDFLVSESSWGMLFGELGPILGLFTLGIKVCFTIKMIRFSTLELKRGNNLPMLLCGIAVNSMLLGNTAQPTSLGFIVLISGLLLASGNFKFINNE